MFGCQGSQLHPRSAAHVVREERGKREEIVRCCWRRRQLTFIPTSDRVLESCLHCLVQNCVVVTFASFPLAT